MQIVLQHPKNVNSAVCMFKRGEKKHLSLGDSVPTVQYMTAHHPGSYFFASTCNRQPVLITVKSFQQCSIQTNLLIHFWSINKVPVCAPYQKGPEKIALKFMSLIMMPSSNLSKLWPDFPACPFCVQRQPALMCHTNGSILQTFICCLSPSEQLLAFKANKGGAMSERGLKCYRYCSEPELSVFLDLNNWTSKELNFLMKISA